MSKTSKPKKQEPNIKAKINIDGNVSNSNIMIGHGNTIINEVVKKEYSLFTIPLPVTDFTGREKELAQLKASFKNGAVITGMSGGGGVGKTELARKLAQEIADDYPDARMSIDLLGTSETPLASEEVMRRILEPFYPNQKLSDEPEQLKGLYQQTFSVQKAILLLDNAASAMQVRPLIPPAPSAAIITSRQHFSLTEFGLSEPLRLDVLSFEESRELLRTASPKLKESPDNEVAALAKLCGHLPLALRVAASILNDRADWTPTSLLKRLGDERTRLQRLKREGDIDLDVEAVLGLSYELLDRELKKNFRILGLFTAPFINISAQALWQIKDMEEVDQFIGKLISLSLLNILPSPFGIGQDGETIYLYALHDLTRLFALNQLLQDEEESRQSIILHADHFLGWAGEADGLYQKGNENILLGLTQFRFIWIHLYSAYERLLPSQKTRPQSADRWLSNFPVTCTYVLVLHLPPREQTLILQTALDAARRLGDKQAEGIHLSNLGLAYAALGDARKAIEFHEQALVIARENGDRHGEGGDLNNLGNAYAALGDARKAIEFHEQYLSIAREIGDRRAEGNALGNLGVAYADLGDARKAIEFHEQALVIAREIGDRRGEGGDLNNLGNAYAALGDARKAIEFLEQALVIAREIGDKRAEGSILGNLGSAYYSLGDARKAIEFLEQYLSIARENGNRRGEGKALGNLGNAYTALGDARKAIEFHEQALVIAREIGDRRGEGADLGSLGNAYYSLGDARKAIEFHEQALVIAREIGDRRGEGKALGNLGNADVALGDAHKAIEFYEQCLELHREIGDRRDEGAALGNLGVAYADLGDARKAIEFYEQALIVLREIGDKRAEGSILVSLGLAYADLGDARKAIEFYEQQLVIVREIGDRHGEGKALGNLGLAYADLGDARKAIEFHEQALVIAREIGDRRDEGNDLGNLGSAYYSLGDARKAIEFYEQQLVIVREIGDRRGEGADLANLGLAYKNLGEKEEARKVWQEALIIYRSIESPYVNSVGKWLADLDKESWFSHFWRNLTSSKR